MADNGAWQQGWAEGRERSSERHAHKQALSDQELEGKIQDLIQKRSDLVAKIPTLQGTYDYGPAVQSLTDVEQGLRDVYHPSKNPSAIQKFGHLLTDHLGITVKGKDGKKETLPQAREKKESVLWSNQQRAIHEQVQSDIAAAPLSADQQATQKYTAQVNAQLAVIDKSNLNDEDKERAREAVFKIYAKPSYKGFDVPGVGYRMFDTNDPESIPDGAVPHVAPTAGNTNLAQYNQGITDGTIPAGTSFAQWTASQKSSTSKFGMNVESYRKLHNIPAGQPLTPDQLNFIEQQIALSSAAPSTNITTSVKQDVNGMWVPVTEANRHVPGFGVILSDPLKGGQSAAGDAVQQPAANGASQSAVHKATPSGTTHPASASKPTANGSSTTKVGAPLFQGRTPAIAKAQNDVVDATKLDSIASQVEKKPNDAFNQKRLAVALERASAGRFTVQALDYIKQIGWGASIDEWAAKPTTGALPPQLVRQLVDGAHENLKAAKDSLQAAIQGTGAAAQSEWPDAPPVGTVEDGDDGKHKYIGGDPAKQESWQKVTQ